MARKLVWIENQKFQGYGCSQCNWVFQPSGAPVGESLAKMIKSFEDQREKEFAAHVCLGQPTSTGQKELTRTHYQPRDRKKEACDIVNGQVKECRRPAGIGNNCRSKLSITFCRTPHCSKLYSFRAASHYRLPSALNSQPLIVIGHYGFTSDHDFSKPEGCRHRHR